MDNRVPSKTYDRYWLVGINTNYLFKKPKDRRASGKWLVFDDVETIDSYWCKIRDALQEGRLGPSVKVSTAKPNPNAENHLTRVICIYTEDFHDLKDVQRIEKELRELGIKNRLVYKLDKDIGKYISRGDNLSLNFVSEEIK